MSYFKRFISGLLVLAAIGFLPKYSFAAGSMNIILNANSMELKGDFGKGWDDIPDKYKDISEQSFRLGFEGELINRVFIGVDLSYFGIFKYEDNDDPADPFLFKHTIMAVSEYAKLNLIDLPLSNENNRMQIYGKAGIGQYYWNFKNKEKISSTIYNDSANKVLSGYNLAAGVNFVLGSNFIIGAEYRYDSTFGDFEGKGSYGTYKAKAFKASQAGVNLGYRFGGTSSNNGVSAPVAANISDNAPAAAAGSNAPQAGNNVSGTVADKTVQTDAALDTKKRNASAINTSDAAKPAAFNPTPDVIELDKDIYLGNMDKIWEAGAANGKIGIPSMGVLFKIGSSKILPYYHEMLNDFIDLYKQTDGKAKILIEGFSSNGGSETEKNPNLSQQRAKAVAEFFIKNEIPKANLEVKAYSNSKVASGMFAGSKGCKGGQCYRRVNVIIK